MTRNYPGTGGVSVREAWNTSKSAHCLWRLSKNPGAIAGLASEVLPQFRSAIPRRMAGNCSLNRRVQSRMHGGVGGGRLVESLPSPTTRSSGTRQK